MHAKALSTRPIVRPDLRSRALLAAVALLALLASACAHTSHRTTAEGSNVTVVNDFIAAWADPDKAVAYLDEKASVRMIEDQPAIVGREAIAAAFKSFMKPGVTLTVETFETWARGPVVVNRRLDTMTTPEKGAEEFPVVGVFVVKGGKIVEWTDYLDK